MQSVSRGKMWIPARWVAWKLVLKKMPEPVWRLLFHCAAEGTERQGAKAGNSQQAVANGVGTIVTNRAGARKHPVERELRLPRRRPNFSLLPPGYSLFGKTDGHGIE